MQSWDFGDGNTSVEADPRHTYTTQGCYFVKHVAIYKFASLRLSPVPVSMCPQRL